MPESDFAAFNTLPSFNNLSLSLLKTALSIIYNNLILSVIINHAYNNCKRRLSNGGNNSNVAARMSSRTHTAQLIHNYFARHITINRNSGILDIKRLVVNTYNYHTGKFARTLDVGGEGLIAQNSREYYTLKRTRSRL